MIEQLLQNHLEELRVIRENANRPRAEEDVGPDGGEGEGEEGGGDEDEEDDLDLDEILVPGGLPGPERPPSNSQTRERSRSPPEEYHGMYS